MPKPNPLQEKAREWRNMGSVLYVRALAGDKEALELMRDAITEAANLFDSLEIIEEMPRRTQN